MSEDYGLSPSAQRVLKRLVPLARAAGQNYVGSEHILLSLLDEESLPWSEWLPKRFNDFHSLRQAAANLTIGRRPSSGENWKPFTSDAQRVIDSLIPKHESGSEVTPNMLLLSVLDISEESRQILGELGVDVDGLRAQVAGKR